MPAHWAGRADSMSEQHQLVSTQVKGWVCLRYLHTHSLKPVLCAQPRFKSVVLAGSQQLSAGGFMVVSLQEGWNGSGEPLDTAFLGFQMLHSYLLAFFLHWSCLYSQAVDWHAVCTSTKEDELLQQVPHAVLKLLYPGKEMWILASKLYYCLSLWELIIL